MKTWKGNNLPPLGDKPEDAWIITAKIDGVNATYKDGKWYSRGGKVFDMLTIVPPEEGVYEVFGIDWESSISKVRGTAAMYEDDLYSLDRPATPYVDDRLFIDTARELSKEQILALLENVTKVGVDVLGLDDPWPVEGLVIINPHTKERIKVKPFESHDVAITGLIEGKGKYTGMLGAVVTDKGKVSGFTDAQRRDIWNNSEDYLGKIIEVRCMGLTKAGQFRHPRFMRFRFDKDSTW